MLPASPRSRRGRWACAGRARHAWAVQQPRGIVPVKATRTLRGPLAAVAMAAALTVSGCATADTAAVVNGQVISEVEARQAAREINEAFKPQTPLDTPGAVQLADRGADHQRRRAAGRQGGVRLVGALGDARCRRADPGATIDLVKANFALQKMSDAEKQMVVDELKKAEITINPRYGSFDRDTGSFKGAEPQLDQAPDEG